MKFNFAFWRSSPSRIELLVSAIINFSLVTAMAFLIAFFDLRVVDMFSKLCDAGATNLCVEKVTQSK